MFIVRGKPSDLAGGVKVIRNTPQDAMETANEGIAVVTIEADGLVYTTAAFAQAVIDPKD